MEQKELGDLTWNELLQHGIHLELDDIVQGKPLKSRVWTLLDLGAQWQAERIRKTYELVKRTKD